MTPQELQALIDGDATAKAHFDAADDALCAARCREIAPKVVVSTRLTDLGILDLAADVPGAAAINASLDAIKTVAASNTLIGRAAAWLERPEGLDIGNALVRASLTLPVVDGGCGLTAEEAAPLLAAAEVDDPSITESAVEKLRTGT